MSTLGQNLIKAPDISQDAQGACSSAGNAVNSATDTVGNGIGQVAGLFGGSGAQQATTNAINGAGNAAGGATQTACQAGADAANQAVKFTTDAINKALGSVAKAIGIKEYYSLHIGNLCEGDYKPLFSDKDAKPDVDSCSPKFSAQKMNLSSALNDELQVGPFKFNFADLDLASDITDAINLIPRALAAMGFFFLFATLGVVAGFVFSLLALATEYFMQGLKKIALLGALGTMFFGWFTSLIGVVGVTIVAEKIKNVVNKDGAKFGMSAETSPALYFLLWASLLFTTLAFAALAFDFVRTRNGRGGRGDVYGGKNQSDDSMGNNGFYTEQLSGGPGGPPPRGQY